MIVKAKRQTLFLSLTTLAFCCLGCHGANESTVAYEIGDAHEVNDETVHSQPPARSIPSSELEISAEKATEKIMNTIASTAEGREAIERIGGKDVALSRFQEANGISDRNAEASIKEWVLNHNWNWEWDLNEVQAICLRNRDHGIPHRYLPESEK